MTTIILLVLAVYFVQLFLQETSRIGLDLRRIVGNRDDLPAPSVVASRLERAKSNMQESLPIFLALALMALIRDGDAGPANHAASVFLVARVVYVPAYASGVPFFRSIMWLLGVASLVAMALALVTVES